MTITTNPHADAERHADERESRQAEMERKADIEKLHIYDVCTKQMRATELHKLRLPTAKGSMDAVDALWEILSDDDELEKALYTLLRHSSCQYVHDFRTTLADIYIERHLDGILANGGFAS